jgi:hypothetical protein
MSFGIPVRNGLGLGLTPSTAVSSGRIGGRPALMLNFVDTTTLDSRVTLTRAANTATRTNSSGVIELVNANLPRFDYDPVTLASRGLLVEESRRNLLLNSLIDGTSLSTQSVTVTAVSHTLSFYGTGSITLSGAATAVVTGTGAYPNRQTLTFTPIVGVLVCTVVGSVQYAQLEINNATTGSSFIPTAGTAVTRNADVATMTGTNFSSWYNQTQGTFVVSASVLWQGNLARSVAVARGAVGITDAINLFIGIGVGGAAGRFRDDIVVAGANQAALGDAAVLVANTPYKNALAYKANDFASATSGGNLRTDTSGTVPTVALLDIGNRNALSYANGHIQSVTYYNTRLSNTQIQALTV